jgi:UDP-N-acetylmuramoylalanine--D-glutamate ligase
MVQNILAASALARSRGVESSEIASAILSFHPSPHRTQYLGEHAGVRWIDDSKATNAHAADASLRALESVVWILGGQLKGVDINELVRTHAPRLRGAVVIGVQRADVMNALARHLDNVPFVEITAVDPAEVMAQALAAAVSMANPGDTVLLSPAAASLDQFESYADRGRRFQAAVRGLIAGAAGETGE